MIKLLKQNFHAPNPEGLILSSFKVTLRYFDKNGIPRESKFLQVFIEPPFIEKDIFLSLDIDIEEEK